MELEFGKDLFTRYERDDYDAMVTLLEDAAIDMDERCRRLRGTTRTFNPTTATPLVMVVVDELATLTALQPDRRLQGRAENALGLLLTKGRAPGFHVLAAVQDVTKRVCEWRDLFPDKIALRLGKATEVDMVLGDDAWDNGALCDSIPRSLPGIGYVLMEGQAHADPGPRRLRHRRRDPRHGPRLPAAPGPPLDRCPQQHHRHPRDGRGSMKVREIPGQLELVFDDPDPDRRPARRDRARTSSPAGRAWANAARSLTTPASPNPVRPPPPLSDRCSFCPVRRSCLASALADDEEYGVWGGTTEIQRDVIRADIAAGVPVGRRARPVPRCSRNCCGGRRHDRAAAASPATPQRSRSC